MTSREEKLAAARKKLRAYMGQTRDKDDTKIPADCSTISPSPSVNSIDTNRGESPLDHERLAWERRDTLQVTESVGSNNLRKYSTGNHLPHLPNPNETLQRPSSVPDTFANPGPSFINPNASYRSVDELPGQEALFSQETQLFQQKEAELLEQLKRQGQAINVLIAERNDAQTALSKVQAILHEKTGELEDLKPKFMDAIQRIRYLEENPPHSGTSMLHISVAEEEKRSQELQRVQERNGVLEEQLQEMRQKLEGKRNECDVLNQDIRQLRNDLSVADVRIQQLSVSETSVSTIRVQELEFQNRDLDAKVALLERRLQAAAVEGEQAGHRFQMYADQCTAQIAGLKNQVRDLSEENVSLKVENERLNKMVTELDAQLVEAKNAGNPLQDRIAHLIRDNVELAKYLNEKEGEIVTLQGACTESGEKLAALQKELNEMSASQRQLQVQADVGRADPALLAAMESDKVAASRAVAQNQRLKEQLGELEAAFVRVSNEKLELVDRLSHEEHEKRELWKQLQMRIAMEQEHHHHHHGDHDHHHDEDHENDDYELEEEQDLSKLKHQIVLLRRDKTELITRLQALTGSGERSFQQQLQQQAQQRKLSHQHNHSHVHNDNGHSHVEGDDNCKDDHEHNHSKEHEHEHDHDHHEDDIEAVNEEVLELRRAVEQLQEDKAELLRRLGGPTDDPKVQGLLQEKLKKTMDEIAALDEEKQRLEHLVLQLQGETETIGEYISLYHKQRQLLHKRSLEKDEQLKQLTRDREELKDKLNALNELVGKVVSRESKFSTSDLTVGVNEESTVQQIKALITEIGNNNVVTAVHHNGVEHCFCCSGQLKTV